MTERAFVGLDINRNAIQASVRPTGEQWMTSVDDTGITETAQKLVSVRPQLVVLEAQGMSELPVAGTLATAGLPFVLVSPRSVRDFARAIGKGRSEGDQAGLLASFGEMVRPEAWIMPPDMVEQLKQLKVRREELVNMLALERSRQRERCIAVQRDVRTHVSFLEKSLILLGEEISRIVRSSRIWR
jgi:transposase